MTTFHDYTKRKSFRPERSDNLGAVFGRDNGFICCYQEVGKNKGFVWSWKEVARDKGSVWSWKELRGDKGVLWSYKEVGGDKRIYMELLGGKRR